MLIILVDNGSGDGSPAVDDGSRVSIDRSCPTLARAISGAPANKPLNKR